MPLHHLYDQNVQFSYEPFCRNKLPDNFLVILSIFQSLTLKILPFLQNQANAQLKSPIRLVATSHRISQ